MAKPKKPVEQAGLKALVLAAHPLADTVPGGLTEDEHAALVEDIRERGMRVPIVLYQGKILDGRARYRAAQAAKVEVRHEVFEGSEDEARYFVMSLNLQRRTLTGMQKALAVAEMYTRAVGKDGAKPSQDTMAKRYGVSKQTISLCCKALASKNTMLLTRMRRGEVTRGELEEEFYTREDANAAVPTGTTGGDGDLFGAAPDPKNVVQFPAGGRDANTPVVGTRNTHPERKAAETPPSALTRQFKALSEKDRLAFVAMAWPWLESAVTTHQLTAKPKPRKAKAA